MWMMKFVVSLGFMLKLGNGVDFCVKVSGCVVEFCR